VLLASVSCMTVELLQYIVADYVVEEAFDRAEASDPKTAAYDANSIAYRAQLWFHRTKLVLGIGAAVVLAVVVALPLLR
jgi:hypothetical protein